MKLGASSHMALPFGTYTKLLVAILTIQCLPLRVLIEKMLLYMSLLSVFGKVAAQATVPILDGFSSFLVSHWAKLKEI